MHEGPRRHGNGVIRVSAAKLIGQLPRVDEDELVGVVRREGEELNKTTAHEPNVRERRDGGIATVTDIRKIKGLREKKREERSIVHVHTVHKFHFKTWALHYKMYIHAPLHTNL